METEEEFSDSRVDEMWNEQITSRLSPTQGELCKEFLQRILPYDNDDVLQITEILFDDVWNESDNAV